MAQRTTKNPKDLTGLNAERLALANQKELKERQGSLGTVTPLPYDVEEVEETVVIGPTSAYIRDDEESEPVEVAIPKVDLRVNSLIEDMTFGAGTNYTFEPGKLYKVDKGLYDHLESKGYVWH